MADDSTYTAGSTSDRNRVRLEIQDTDNQRWLFADVELDDFLAQDGSVLLAAAHAAETMAARMAREYDFSADGASFSRSQQTKAWLMMAVQLRRRANSEASPVVFPTRVDGYSDDISSEEVNVNRESSFDRSGLVN